METIEIGFIQACWQKNIVDEIKAAFLKEILDRHQQTHIQVIEVPGILEIPLQAKLCSKTGKYSAIVAAGLISTGGIYRYEFVAQSVINAIIDVQLKYEVPIISAILTPLDSEDEERETYFLEHSSTKGKEAAQSCIQILKVMGVIS